MRIFVYYTGKPKDAALNAYAHDFLERAGRFCPVESREIQPAKFDVKAKHPSALRIGLDPGGRTMDSAAFSNLFAAAERDVVFVIGAHEGLTGDQRGQMERLLSLSPMTFSHELARAILAEQIFRAFAMLRNHPYVR